MGKVSLDEEQIICVFNSEQEERDFEIKLEYCAEITDFWTEEKIGVWDRGEHHIRLAAHSARALVIAKPK